MITYISEGSMPVSSLQILSIVEDFTLSLLVEGVGRLCQKNELFFASSLLVRFLIYVFWFAEYADLQADGGGIRGYSTLLLLKAVFEELEDIQGHPILPCEVFDMMAGTSTGG